jgi:DNA-directed RNA polymerase subunit RPC12/RpoP
MARVSCRCGEKIKVQPDSPDRIDCPKCGARIRLRRPAPKVPSSDGDGYLRFLCPCGRRLKVPAADRPVAGRCPDCGRVVPVPVPVKVLPATGSTPAKAPAMANSEARTEELDANDLAQLDQWAGQYHSQTSNPDGPGSTTTHLLVATPGVDSTVQGAFRAPAMPMTSVVKFEAGLRVCPRCKKPIHLGATRCRECGNPVPRA